jgi:hypothetical protein
MRFRPIGSSIQTGKVMGTNDKIADIEMEDAPFMNPVIPANIERAAAESESETSSSESDSESEDDSSSSDSNDEEVVTSERTLESKAASVTHKKPSLKRKLSSIQTGNSASSPSQPPHSNGTQLKKLKLHPTSTASRTSDLSQSRSSKVNGTIQNPALPHRPSPGPKEVRKSTPIPPPRSRSTASPEKQSKHMKALSKIGISPVSPSVHKSTTPVVPPSRKISQIVPPRRTGSKSN